MDRIFLDSNANFNFLLLVNAKVGLGIPAHEMWLFRSNFYFYMDHFEVPPCSWKIEQNTEGRYTRLTKKHNENERIYLIA